LVSTLKRPVPLQHGIWWDNKINYFLYGDKDWKLNIWNDISNKINNYYKKNQFSLNQFFSCIKYLFDNNMTPVNIFLLNRSLCNQYAKKLPFHFVTSEESCIIQNIWDNRLNKYKKLYETTEEWNELLKLVIKGIGVHHSGMIPILKEIVEILYSEGLIKILLATETFSMGVNMPTKTVIFCNLTKFDGNNSKRILNPEEYGQMAGRSGRRCKDIIGNVIILPYNNFIDESSAKKMILSPPQKISSKFLIDSIYILKQIGINNEIDKNNETLKLKCYDSLFHYQEYKEEYYENILFKIDNLNIDKNLIENDINIYNKINEIDNNIKLFKLNSKQKNKLNEEKIILENQINYKLIDTYINLKYELDKIEKLKNKIDINNQINILITFLINNNYLIMDNNKFILTKLGKILSEINECNPFLLSEIIFLDLFNELELNEIIAVCSIFINENKNNEEITINDLNCSIKCKELLHLIEKNINKYYNLEDELNKTLPYPIWLNWEINYSMFDDIKNWSSKINVNINGNFIKSILRVNNLLKNIDNIANIFNNINLINKLYQYQENLIRDSVITDSLYI
jgi:antiviral helicase SKI2